MLAESPTMLQRSGRSQHYAYGQAEGETGYTISYSQPSAPLWIDMNIAQARARAGLEKYDDAIAQLSDLLIQAPTRSEIYVELAKILSKAGKVQDAINVLEKGMDKVANKGPLLFYLAHYYYDIGDVERSVKLTGRAEAAGMKMDSLRKRFKEENAASEPPTPTTPRDIGAATVESK